jgi:hypothetical protein
MTCGQSIPEAGPGNAANVCTQSIGHAKAMASVHTQPSAPAPKMCARGLSGHTPNERSRHGGRAQGARAAVGGGAVYRKTEEMEASSGKPMKVSASFSFT